MRRPHLGSCLPPGGVTSATALGPITGPVGSIKWLSAPALGKIGIPFPRINRQNQPTRSADAGTDVAARDCCAGRLGVAHLWRSDDSGSDTFVARGRYRAPRALVGSARVILWRLASALWAL